jgi:hypothetical protein
MPEFSPVLNSTVMQSWRCDVCEQPCVDNPEVKGFCAMCGARGPFAYQYGYDQEPPFVPAFERIIRSISNSASYDHSKTSDIDDDAIAFAFSRQILNSLAGKGSKK